MTTKPKLDQLFDLVIRHRDEDGNHSTHFVMPLIVDLTECKLLSSDAAFSREIRRVTEALCLTSRSRMPEEP